MGAALGIADEALKQSNIPDLPTLTGAPSADAYQIVYQDGQFYKVPVAAIPGMGWSPAALGSALVAWVDPTQASTVTGSPVNRIASPKTSLGKFAQFDPADRPAIASGRMSFDGTSDMLLQAAAYTIVGSTTWPDAVSSETGKGLTSTGMVRDTDGTWWVGNYGKKNQGTAGAETFNSSVVHVAADRVTKLGEINLTALGQAQGSLQGTAIDTVASTLWCACPDSGLLHNFTKAGVYIGNLNPGVSVNGLAYDSINDCLIITTGATSGPGTLRWINKATGATIKTLAVVAESIDQLAFSEEAHGSQGSVYVSMDGAAQFGLVVKYDVEAEAPVRVWQFPEILSIEGIVVADGRLYVANDAYYHDSGPTNVLVEVETDTATADGSTKMFIAGVFKSNATPISAKAIVAGGDPLFGRGAALYFTSVANQLRLSVNTGAATAQVDWTLTSTTTEFIAFVAIDSVAKTAALYANGTLVSSQALTTVSGEMLSTSWALGGGIDNGSYARYLNGTIGPVVVAVTDSANRLNMEGYLAWQAGLVSLLPSDHQNKYSRP